MSVVSVGLHWLVMLDDLVVIIVILRSDGTITTITETYDLGHMNWIPYSMNQPGPTNPSTQFFHEE